MKRAVLVSCFNWYEVRLKYVKEVLENKNYKVDIITSNFNHHLKKNEVKKFPEIQYINVPKYKKNISISRLFSHYVFAEKVYRSIKDKNYDLIYCIIPPNFLAYKIKKIYKKNANTAIYFDVIDLWPEAFPIEKFKKNLIFKLWADLRNKNLNISKCVFIECNLYCNTLKKYITNDKIYTLYLTSPKKYFDEKIKNANSKIVFCYLGSINSLIDIDSICIIIKKASKIKPVVLNIIGGGIFSEKLINLARNNGAYVNDYGYVFEDTLKANILNNSHFGLNLYHSHNIGLTIKSIDYFSAGLPIINSIKGDTWDFVEKYNLGKNFDGQEICNDFFIYDYNRKNIYEFYLKHFSIDAFKLNIEKTIEE